MDRVRLGGKEITELHQPLRHPRPLVEQRPGGQERLQRDIDDGGGAGQVLAETQVSAPHRLVAEEFQLSAGGSPTRIGEPS